MLNAKAFRRRGWWTGGCSGILCDCHQRERKIPQFLAVSIPFSQTEDEAGGQESRKPIKIATVTDMSERVWHEKKDWDVRNFHTVQQTLKEAAFLRLPTYELTLIHSIRMISYPSCLRRHECQMGERSGASCELTIFRVIEATESPTTALSYCKPYSTSES